MPKRVLQGTVVSDKNDKTVVVRVERRFTHPVMQKTVRSTKKYKAHDESNACKVGDTVLDWGPKDVFVVPSWMKHSHAARKETVLFSISDRPAQEALGIWREKH